MNSRCPSCGSPAREEERLCASCGWDFEARKSAAKPVAAAPSPIPLPPGAPESAANFPQGLNSFPKLEPREPNRPAESETPLTIPTLAPAPPPSVSAPKVDVVPDLPAPEPALPKSDPAPALTPEAKTQKPSPPQAPETPKPPAGSRSSPVMTAAIAGAVLGTASVLAVYLLMRPDTVSGSRPAGASPFRRMTLSLDAAPPVAAPASVPASQSSTPTTGSPAPMTAPEDAARPSASFAAAPRARVEGEEAKPVEAPAKPRQQAEEESWVFKGLVFDLLTTQGVSGVRLSFLDRDGNVVGETDTSSSGRYEISLPAAAGCTLKISRDGYTGRYIEEGDATSALREATPEERQTLMSAVARNLPWTGDPKKPLHRDIALMPSAEDP